MVVYLIRVFLLMKIYPQLVEKIKLQDGVVQVPAGIDKGCRAPCSEILEPVKDPQVELALKGDEAPGNCETLANYCSEDDLAEEKPVQVAEEVPVGPEDDGSPPEIQDIDLDNQEKDVEKDILPLTDQPEEAVDLAGDEPLPKSGGDSSDQLNFTEITYGVVEPPEIEFVTLEEGDTTGSVSLKIGSQRPS